MNTETALTTVPAAPPAQLSAFQSIESFEAVQRMAKLLCASSIVPQSYRDNLGDAVIALEMANRIGANPLAVMQNLYIVHGKPAWSSQFLISCVNASGKFSPLRYVLSEPEAEEEISYSFTVYVNGQKSRREGKQKIRNRECYAWAMDRAGERLESPLVSIRMAVTQGWYNKDGSKWQDMPDLMLRYRAATLFARLYAPELTMGIQTDSEIIDIGPVVTDPVARAKPVYQFKEKVEPAPEPVIEPAAMTSGEAQAEPSPVQQLTPIEKAMLEIPGATFEDFREFAAGQFPQAGLHECLSMADFLPLVIFELSKPAKLKALKVWLRSGVEQRSVKP